MAPVRMNKFILQIAIFFIMVPIFGSKIGLFGIIFIVAATAVGFVYNYLMFTIRINNQKLSNLVLLGGIIVNEV